jgi:hypothetical protein
MRSTASFLAVIGLVSLVITGCDSKDLASPNPVVAAASDTSDVVTAQQKTSPKPSPYPAPGTCTSETSGGYTCTTCTSAGGGVITITCVPAAVKMQ